MLTKVEVRTPLGLLLVLPLDDVSDGLVLEDIQGLDPVKATLVSSTFANFDGAHFQSSRREIRNIVLTLGLEPDYVTSSVRDLRLNLYSYFMPESQVSLRFYMSEGLTVDISGKVESFEAPLFVKEPQAVISIVCFDPDFVELAPITVTGNTVSTSTEFVITYNGSVPAGIILEVDVNRSLSEFTLYHRAADGVTRTFDLSAAMVSGDVVKVSTLPGLKTVTLTRASVTSSLLYGMAPQSSWIELQKGDNNLRVYATGAAVPYNIKYTPKYGGL